MQIAPFSWRAWWNAAPAACRVWVAMKFPLPSTPKASRTPSAASVRPTTSAAVEDSIDADHIRGRTPKRSGEGGVRAPPSLVA